MCPSKGWRPSGNRCDLTAELCNAKVPALLLVMMSFVLDCLFTLCILFHNIPIPCGIRISLCFLEHVTITLGLMNIGDRILRHFILKCTQDSWLFGWDQHYGQAFPHRAQNKADVHLSYFRLWKVLLLQGILWVEPLVTIQRSAQNWILTRCSFELSKLRSDSKCRSQTSRSTVSATKWQ